MKRFFDFTVSLLLIIALIPVFLIIALVVLIDSGYPVIFKQYRVGKDNKLFYIYKFRTMKVNTRNTATEDLKEANSVITKSGRILRKTSLDELPQLFNILKGDMSIVGPRPLLVQYLPLYNAQQKRRHEVRPGLTGYAQVHGRNAITWEEKFRLDVEYVDNITFYGDIKIIWGTVLAVFRRDGISSETSATMEVFTGTKLPVA